MNEETMQRLLGLTTTFTEPEVLPKLTRKILKENKLTNVSTKLTDDLVRKFYAEYKKDKPETYKIVELCADILIEVFTNVITQSQKGTFPKKDEGVSFGFIEPIIPLTITHLIDAEKYKNPNAIKLIKDVIALKVRKDGMRSYKKDIEKMIKDIKDLPINNPFPGM